MSPSTTSVSSQPSCLSNEFIIDRVLAMRKLEGSDYCYRSYLPSSLFDDEQYCRLNVTWREKICQWAYHVIDHFDLSRELVAISLDLFDRFLATQGNECTGNMALLTSLTTLHVATKIHDTKKIKISTLANLSRGQFGPSHIAEMEWKIVSALGWKLHPPTSCSFIGHLLLLMSCDAMPMVKKQLYELSNYMAELAVCDSYFVECNKSTIAFASILNAMEDISFTRLSRCTRERFLRNISEIIGYHALDKNITEARKRLKSMFASSGYESFEQSFTQTHRTLVDNASSCASADDTDSLSSSSSSSDNKSNCNNYDNQYDNDSMDIVVDNNDDNFHHRHHNGGHHNNLTSRHYQCSVSGSSHPPSHHHNTFSHSPLGGHDFVVTAVQKHDCLASSAFVTGFRQ